MNLGKNSSLDSPDLDDASQYLAKNINEQFSEQLTIGQRLADKVATFGGSWPFISIFALCLFVWMFYQTIITHNKSFDPYPYILLNLMLSCLAAVQAPIIMMSQNRLAAKDRLQADHDYEVNLKAEVEIEHIQDELESIRRKQEQQIMQDLREVKSLLVEVNQRLEGAKS